MAKIELTVSMGYQRLEKQAPIVCWKTDISSVISNGGPDRNL
jgi:hypothetical protein